MPTTLSLNHASNSTGGKRPNAHYSICGKQCKLHGGGDWGGRRATGATNKHPTLVCSLCFALRHHTPPHPSPSQLCSSRRSEVSFQIASWLRTIQRNKVLPQRHLANLHLHERRNGDDPNLPSAWKWTIVFFRYSNVQGMGLHVPFWKSQRLPAH